MLKYIVEICGGRGDAVWEKEIAVEAQDFDCAYKQVKELINDGSVAILSITQEF